MGVSMCDGRQLVTRHKDVSSRECCVRVGVGEHGDG